MAALEVVKSEDVFRFLLKSEPDLTWAELARRMNLDESAIRRWRREPTMLFSTADSILSEFGLNYLFQTGDIPTYEKQVNHKPFNKESLAKAHATQRRNKAKAKAEAAKSPAP